MRRHCFQLPRKKMLVRNRSKLLSIGPQVLVFYFEVIHKISQLLIDIFLLGRFQSRVLAMPDRTYVTTDGDVIYTNQVYQVDPSNNGTTTTADNTKYKNKPGCNTHYIMGGVLLIISMIAVGAVVAVTNRNRRMRNRTPPTSAPTVALCPDKRLRITHICNLPDLDDDWFGRDTTMDIKVLFDNQQYWPRDVQADCPDGKNYKEACVISDTFLMVGCYELNNPAALAIGTEEGNLLEPRDLKITIYDEDIGTDDFLDIFVPLDDWYFPSNCDDGLDLEFFVKNKATSVKVTVDTIEEGEEELCGANLDVVNVGLRDTAAVLEGMQTTLDQYVKLHEDADRRLLRHDKHRQLLFPALFAGARFLATGVTRLVGGFARGAARNTNPLSVLADITTIGSVWFSSNGPAASDHWEETEDYFKQVLERFDVIDTKLDGIQSQLQKGFQAIELVINQAFAKQELDDWVNGHLKILDEDYRAYLNPAHTPETRKAYEDVFRNSCGKDHSPFTTFKALYSHSCKACNLLDGASQQYILDTFVELANSNFEDLTDRVLWFRKSFGTVIIGAMTEAIYLHSVCLYQLDSVCQNEDPVWIERLEKMGTAMEEVASSLVEAEKQLE
jgi:hypothetical protein